jgi:protein SCO1/2
MKRRTGSLRALVALLALGPAVSASPRAVAASPRAVAAATQGDQGPPIASVMERVGFDQRLGEQLPLDARFVDEAGRDVRLADLVGERPVIVAFVYYECPMLCTLVLNGLVSSLRAVDLTPGKDFAVVAIGIDPSESPELARAKKARYLDEYGRSDTADGWHFLTGAEPEIARVAAAAGFRYAYVPEKDEYAHASGIVVATPDGRLARYYYGIEYAPRDVRLGLVEASDGKVGTLVDQVLLLCYHWDPLSGRYGLAIMTVIRFLGGVTVLGIGLFVGRALLRDRRVALAQGRGTGS